MKTETPDQSHKLLKLCQWDTKFEEQSAHMMSKTCSSFNKLWFCKKQLKEIAREILLLGVLMLFRKTYRINQGLLNKPEVTLCIPGKGIRGVHNCWKSWKGRGRSHPQRSRKPGLKASAWGTEAGGPQGFVRKSHLLQPPPGDHGLCSATFRSCVGASHRQVGGRGLQDIYSPVFLCDAAETLERMPGWPKSSTLAELTKIPPRASTHIRLLRPTQMLGETEAGSEQLASAAVERNFFFLKEATMS